jgi:hypothetical protein
MASAAASSSFFGLLGVSDDWRVDLGKTRTLGATSIVADEVGFPADDAGPPSKKSDGTPTGEQRSGKRNENFQALKLTWNSREEINFQQYLRRQLFSLLSFCFD